MSLLARILDRKRLEVAALRARRLPDPPGAVRPPTLGRARGGALHLIAEIKRRSPSAGELSQTLSVSRRASAYEAGGASMLSVLTDGHFFGGSFEDLSEAHAACSLPVLCKEFVIDEIQLDAARAYGADAVLLIVRCVSPARLHELVAAARARSLTPVVEVVTDDEARVALDAGADHIGVNARDLDTLAMDATRAAEVLARLPEQVVALHLSGLGSTTDVERVARSRADAALVGEALMRRDDPLALLRELKHAAGS